MFAGKSSTLLWELERQTSINGGESVYICHSSDCRPELSEGRDGITTHSRIARVGSKAISVHKVEKLSDISDFEIGKYTAIGIDEAQFFEADDLETSVTNWIKKGSFMSIFVSGLDGTFEQTAFKNSGIVRLLPIADEFVKLTTAVCLNCFKIGIRNKPAPFTARKYLPREGDSLIGGADAYEAVCRQHHPTSSGKNSIYD
jgi:thymidine kinase